MKFKHFLCTSLSALTIFSSSSCVFASNDTNKVENSANQVINYIESKAKDKQISDQKIVLEELVSILKHKEDVSSVSEKTKKFIKKNKISTKSRSTASLLWFFLGGIGANDFYAGKTVSGILKLINASLSIFFLPFRIAH
ncbi:MAG: TM2 domain-containing protein, partial [Clostridia bacterium]|nr:TM2 domain-containing protein [Clostridia bacterium]